MVAAEGSAVEAVKPTDKLRWRLMTPAQKAFLANGCGGKGGLLKPPDFCFRASCDQHDVNYQIGYTERHRRRADRQFLQAMLRDAIDLPFLAEPVAILAAIAYYRAVRRFGGAYFNYSDREYDIADLAIDMELFA